LGERVGWRRWTAILVGFIGVVIALRPSASMLRWEALIPLAGTLIYANVLIVTRAVRGTADRVLLFEQHIGIVILAGAVWWIKSGVPEWAVPPLADLCAMAVIGVLAVASAICINRSLAFAKASVVVPYHYSMLLWTAIFGYAVFGEVPQPPTLIGAALIVVAGLYIFMREQTLARQRLAGRDQVNAADS
ncbi:MAG: DMT family transporter, partial [Pseudorhodoplanes sp.]